MQLVLVSAFQTLERVCFGMNTTTALMIISSKYAPLNMQAQDAAYIVFSATSL